ncbi:MAG: hypothetical protein KF724_05135 [Phycisphaeraceae bacterium]|nr:hypothetical protein [Phycisphaeraceae bacterium]
MARRGRPVLYELLDPSQTETVPGARSAPGRSEGAVASSRQSIRVPIGWFWLAAVVALALVAVAYQFGRAAGERSGFARGQEWRGDREEQSRLATATPDPARSATAVPDRPSAGRSESASGGTRTSEVERTTAGRGRESASAGSGLIESDPRQKGLNYWIVARTSPDEAARMAPFIRSQGLEVAVVPDNNPRFVRIVALPGTTEGRSSEASRRMEARIKSIGKLWKNAGRGNRDFDDTYPELYR